MAQERQVTNQIFTLLGLKGLIQAYEEIAAMRMRSTRSSVLLNRNFNEGLLFIFQRIKSSYRAQIDALMSKRGTKKTTKDRFTLLKRNGRINCVLITANTKLYGDILQRTYFSFVDYLKKNKGQPIDVTIIGRVGQKLYEEDFPGQKYFYAEFPDSDVPVENLTTLIQHLITYEKIYFFYGKFQTVASQVSAVLDIYGKEEQVTDDTHTHYLFEPSLEDILVIFESEIFASIIEQTLRESILAKYASRMVTLDQAAEKIRGDLKKIEFARRVAKHRAQNKKELENLRNIYLWK